jgi:proteic killer suppression protein
VIRSFNNKDTEALFNDRAAKRFVNIADVARRKLFQLHIAERLDDLKVPPGNRLEPLKGKRKGQYSIRINDQWRICFKWTDGGADDVEIVDYH